MKKKKRTSVKRLIRSFFVVLGVVLIWRAIWYGLDLLDRAYLGGTHLWSTLGGLVLGILILYIPDRDLDELAKL
jgi:hypothetical protein